MVKNSALALAILSALPASAIAQDTELPRQLPGLSVCGEAKALTPCEETLFAAGMTWEGRAKEARAKLLGCLDKLRVRTSTVIRDTFVPPVPELKPTFKHDAMLLSIAGISGLGMGVVLGILLIQ